jgi:hypothetical protein
VKPQIILALGPVKAPADAIVIDYLNSTFRRGTECRRLHSNRPDVLPIGFRAIACLIVASPGCVSHDDILQAVYGDDPNGGPIWAVSSMTSVISSRRDLLTWLGARVSSQRGFGHRLEFVEWQAIAA